MNFDDYLLNQQRLLDEREKGVAEVMFIVADNSILCYSDSFENVEKAYEFKIKRDFTDYETISLGYLKVPEEEILNRENDQELIDKMQIIKTHKK